MSSDSYNRLREIVYYVISTRLPCIDPQKFVEMPLCEQRKYLRYIGREPAIIQPDNRTISSHEVDKLFRKSIS